MKAIKILTITLCSVFLMSTLYAQTPKGKAKPKPVAAAKYQCPMKCEGDKTYSKAGRCPECGMTLKAVKAAPAAYQCTMKCEGDKTYAKAGKCPVCGMEMKKAVAEKEDIKPAMQD